MPTDYSTVTETWGLAASPEQVTMQYARYKTAGDLAEGKRLLEIGSGAGMGIDYLRSRTALTVGGDYTMSLVREARAHVPEANVARFDAQHLPFQGASFDVLLMLEMIYYIPDLDQAMRECRRVMADGGSLMICVPNKERPDFNPSPFAVEYHSAADLARLLEKHHFAATVYGGFPIEAGASRDRALAPLRHLAVRYHLIPNSMRAKALIKRALYGPLPKLGAMRDGATDYPKLVELDPAAGPHRAYKTIYAIGRKQP